MKQISTYGDSLVKAISQFFPGRFFSHWKLSANTCWTVHRVVVAALLMVYSAEQTIFERFAAVAELLKSLYPKWRLGQTYQGWCQAQLKWVTAVAPAMAKHMRQCLQEFAGSYGQRHGWCAFAADGSRHECPRTDTNKKALGCAGKEKTGPQLFVTTLWHMGTGLPWDYRIGPGTASERRHLEAMLGDLPKRSLLVADAGFTGYELLGRIDKAKQKFLVRVGSNVHLLQKLGYYEQEGPSTIYLWPQDFRDQPPLVLRLIKLVQGQKKMFLLTNVLDTEALSSEQAALLYEMRWGVELFYRGTKQTLNRRRMHSRTAATCQAELHWIMLGIWLLGAMSVRAILARGQDPLSWSVALSRKQVREAMRKADQKLPKGKDLLVQLGSAVKDAYTRLGSKKAHDWPHKKREKPPGDPKIRLANKAEIKKAKKVRENLAVK